jgi:sugar phosphate isomerase/epimerase
MRSTCSRPIGIAPLTHLELSPPEMVVNAAEAGYDFLGLRLVPATPNEPCHDTRGDTPLIRQTARCLRDSGIKVLDIEIFRLRPDTRVSDYEPALAAGAVLGARHALAAPQDADVERLADTLGAFAELAARYGILVDLEPTPWYEISRLATSEAVIAQSGRDDVGIVVDAIHFDRAGDTAESIEALPKRRFRYVQLCDAPAERPLDLPTLLHQARAERLIPGDGGLDLRGLLSALPPGLPISLEIPMNALSATTPPLERVRRMRAKTLDLLTAVDSF